VIGIFGGTFDPIHYGHLRAALEVQEIFHLTELRFIPSATPPHRPRPAVTAAQRQQMVTLAIQHQAGFICDNRELERDGKSYMVDTLASLRHDLPQQSLLLFIGTDAFNQLNQWYHWQQLFDFAHIVVMTRPSFHRQALGDFFAARYTDNPADLTQCLAGKLYFQAISQLDISASAIRQILAKQHSPRFLLPDAVLNFIQHNQLYQQEH
jgi:nicotinate-nucleotide adenylyltransferase